MSQALFAAFPPFTTVVREALERQSDAAFAADLLFFEAWEMAPSMDLGSTLRAAQIRRAIPDLAEALSRELQAARIWRSSSRLPD